MPSWNSGIKFHPQAGKPRNEIALPKDLKIPPSSHWKKKNPEQGKPTHYQWLAKNKNKNKRSQLLENSDKLMQKLPGNLTNMQKIVSINERKHIDESDHKLDEQWLESSSG